MMDDTEKDTNKKSKNEKLQKKKEGMEMHIKGLHE